MADQILGEFHINLGFLFPILCLVILVSYLDGKTGDYHVLVRLKGRAVGFGKGVFSLHLLLPSVFLEEEKLAKHRDFQTSSILGVFDLLFF